MVFMLLDHTRMYFHNASLHIDPTDLSKASAALFLTRWITHPVAPVFIFLAGTGAYLQTIRGKTKGDISRFLLTRGAWLVILEFTVVRIGINFNVDYATFFGSMQVIWVIGVSMVILALLVRFPLPVIAALSIVVIAGHNLLDGIQVASWKGSKSATPGFPEVVWLILHQRGAFLLCDFPCPRVFVLYTLIPWAAVMAAGFCFGAIYKMESKARQRLLLAGGAVLTIVFFVVRGLNVYGDPHPWEPQKNWLFTVFSFLDVTKYPASLLFLLMTLGPAFMTLALLERVGRTRLTRMLVTLGRVPLFFYLLQFYLAHGLAVLVGFLAGQPVAHQFAPYRRSLPGVGFDLWVVYLFWIIGLVMLYPLCRWYAGVKQRHRSDWRLSYL
jgi:uncharacterized membrane protein